MASTEALRQAYAQQIKEQHSSHVAEEEWIRQRVVQDEFIEGKKEADVTDT